MQNFHSPFLSKSAASLSFSIHFILFPSSHYPTFIVWSGNIYFPLPCYLFFILYIYICLYINLNNFTCHRPIALHIFLNQPIYKFRTHVSKNFKIKIQKMFFNSKKEINLLYHINIHLHTFFHLSKYKYLSHAYKLNYINNLYN